VAGASVVTIDGVIGPASLAAIERVDWRELTRQYLVVRAAYYNGLVAKNASQGVFLKGWLNRLARLKSEVGIND
jgi:lysozyme family protein